MKIDVAAKMDAGLLLAGMPFEAGAETFEASYKRVADVGKANVGKAAPAAVVKGAQEARAAGAEKAAGDQNSNKVVTHVPPPAGVASPVSSPLLPLDDGPLQPDELTKDVEEKPFAAMAKPPEADPVPEAQPGLVSVRRQPIVTELPPFLLQEKLVAAPAPSEPQKISGPAQTSQPVAATPEKKNGKGLATPEVPLANGDMPVTLVVPAGEAALVPESTTEKTVPAVAQPMKATSVSLAFAPVPLSVAPILTKPGIASAGTPQVNSSKKASAPNKEAPIVVSNALHADQPAQKPVIHGEAVQSPAQKLEVTAPTTALADAQLTPVTAAAPSIVAPLPTVVGSTAAAPVLPSTPTEPAKVVQPEDVRTLSSTAQTLEVGVASGTHGWLRVRAEMGDAGQVVASVMASSPVAAEALHRGLPALHEYLAHEQMGLISVAISPPRAGTEGVGAGIDSQAGAQQQRSQQAAAAGNTGVRGGDFDDASMTSFEVPLTSMRSDGSGWLSVRV